MGGSIQISLISIATLAEVSGPFFFISLSDKKIDSSFIFFSSTVQEVKSKRF